MSESDLSPKELSKVELLIPAYKRRHKLNARRELSKQLKYPNSGGIRSPLDPINPHKLTEFGEPTIVLKKEDIVIPNKN